MPTISDLRQRQALPLGAKVLMSQSRIREWYTHFDGDVYVSFSGGKDSTVLAHLVHDMYPDVPLVFGNTGLEFPEIQSFARKMGEEFIRPKLSFSEVISKWGYPILGKEIAESIMTARTIARPDFEYKRLYLKRQEFDNERKDRYGQSVYNKPKYKPLAMDTQFKISHMCCYEIKKRPLHSYQTKTKRVPIIGTLAEESQMRTTMWIRNGCNAFDAKSKRSQPLSFWTEQDILRYIQQEGLEIASVYGDIVATDKSGFEYDPLLGIECNLKCTGCQRTGCIFCGFGAHLEKGETRFQRLAKTHPRQYEYCMNGGQWVDNPAYDPTAPKYDGEWKNWNPKKIWVPSKEGLGMKKVFDDCNQIYGKDFIRYE